MVTTVEHPLSGSGEHSERATALYTVPYTLCLIHYASRRTRLMVTSLTKVLARPSVGSSCTAGLDRLARPTRQTI